MPRYIVERSFPDRLLIPPPGGALAVVERNADEGVTWVHSYVSDDKTKSFCVYDAPSPEAIRKTASRQRAAGRADHAGARARSVLLLVRSVMTMFRRMRLQDLHRAALTLGLVGLALQFSSPASAEQQFVCRPGDQRPDRPCDRVGRPRLRQGAGRRFRRPRRLLPVPAHLRPAPRADGGRPFACSDNANPLGAPCDTVLWPALLTDGAPIAGPGVNPTLLGTVTRTDLPGLRPVQQVTYAGQPLYRFFFDEEPGETEGANLFDPVTSPTGIWYLVEPSRGQPATGQAHCSSRPRRSTAPGRARPSWPRR